MSVEEALRIIWNPATLEATRERLRSAVYARFDELYEESTGRRPRANQSVWDGLAAAKEMVSSGRRFVVRGGEATTRGG